MPTMNPFSRPTRLILPPGTAFRPRKAHFPLKIAGTSNNTNNVSTPGQSADSNYNQSQMQDVLNKLDEFLNAARR